ncbi:UNVERIFIED_ORG: hypothetical protein B2H98_16440 [Clostridium botulinum]
MKLTSNYSLKKPDGSDVVNVQDFNDNSDKIDLELKKVDWSLKEKVNGVTRIFTNENISELKLPQEFTCSELAEKMKEGDIISIRANQPGNGDSYGIVDTPYKYGSLFVYRQDSNRINFEFRPVDTINGQDTLNEKYIAFYRRLSPNNKFSGWKQIATVDDTGWIELVLLNELTMPIGDKAMYRRIGKIVFFKGVVSNIKTNGVIISNLPLGFRPNSINGGPSIPLTAYMSGANTPTKLSLNKNGNLVLIDRGSSETLYLDNVIFVLD